MHYRKSPIEILSTGKRDYTSVAPLASSFAWSLPASAALVPSGPSAPFLSGTAAGEAAPEPPEAASCQAGMAGLPLACPTPNGGGEALPVLGDAKPGRSEDPPLLAPAVFEPSEAREASKDRSDFSSVCSSVREAALAAEVDSNICSG